MTRRHRPCPVCAHAKADVVHDNHLAVIDGLDMSYRVARCRSCGFHFADELPSDADYTRYYTELSKYDSLPSVSPLDRQRIEAAVALCRQHLAPGSRIIDIGCGFGALLAALRDAGWPAVAGVDPAPASARQARQQFGLESIQQGTLAEAGTRIDLEGADLVCLMAVLEHLPQLSEDLAKLLAQMRPGSRLLVEVPALEYFDPTRGEPLGELSIEHIQFFSAQSLHNLFGQLGVRVVAEHLLPLPVINTGALFVLAEKEKSTGEGKDLQPESPAGFDAYLAGSRRRLNTAMRRVPREPFVLYGAGSHSARLLPLLDDAARERIRAVLDGNVNLQGKRFGAWTVQAPETLAEHSRLPVLISSYRAEHAIAHSLKARFSNPLVPMYGA